jgi:hypothetical protein
MHDKAITFILFSTAMYCRLNNCISSNVTIILITEWRCKWWGLLEELFQHLSAAIDESLVWIPGLRAETRAGDLTNTTHFCRELGLGIYSFFLTGILHLINSLLPFSERGESCTF